MPSRGSRVTRSILSSFFARDCAWRARVPARKRVTKRSSRSISSCWRSIARPSASSRAAFSLRQACQVPLKKLAAAGLELEHRGAHRLEEPAVVGDEHDGGVERLQVALEPLQRGDVEVVGRLVEQQQVGVARERAGERRARELAAGEGRERAVEVLVAEAEAVQRRVDLVAPAVAAGVLEPRLGGRVGAERGRVGRALGHRGLELGQALLDRQQLLGAAEHVVAQRELALARRALVVQRDPRALREHELAAVDRGLPREHPQQRRLARAVAPGQRQALPALEPERDAAQQRLPHHVLGEV